MLRAASFIITKIVQRVCKLRNGQTTELEVQRFHPDHTSTCALQDPSTPKFAVHTKSAQAEYSLMLLRKTHKHIITFSRAVEVDAMEESGATSHSL